MAYKIFTSIVAAALLLVFIGPVVVKLKDAALIVVASIGVLMMLVDIWQAARAKDE